MALERYLRKFQLPEKKMDNKKNNHIKTRYCTKKQSALTVLVNLRSALAAVHVRYFHHLGHWGREPLSPLLLSPHLANSIVIEAISSQ